MIRGWEQKAETYLRAKYPPKRNWVNTNLEVIQSIKKRKDFKSDGEVVNWAIKTTEQFAQQSGINNNNRMEEDVLHIPSRLAAIRRFEAAEHPFHKQLSLDKVVQIYIIAETTNLRRSVGFASSDQASKDLDNLAILVELHKELTGL